jgi:hypothetical protein
VRSAVLLATASLAVLAVLVGLLAVRLARGPVAIPYMARLAEAEIASRLGQGAVSVGAVVFALGRGEDDPSGLRLQDVTLFDAAGVPVFSAEEVGARFRIGEAIGGVIAPTEIMVAGAAIRITRETDGSLALAFMPGSLEAAPAESRGPAEGALAAFFDLLARRDVPGLRRLDSIRLARIALVYDDRLAGRVWRAEDGTVTVDRDSYGLSARIEASVSGTAGGPTALSVTVEHRWGHAGVEIGARFADARPEDIADQVPALAWLRPLVAPVSGELQIEMTRDGRLGYLTAGLRLGAGEIRPGTGAAVAVRQGELALAYDGRNGRLTVEALALDSDLVRLEADGHADMVLAGERVVGLVAQLRLRDIEIRREGTFAAPLGFAEGRLALRAGFAPLGIEIGEASLMDGETRIAVSGEARLEPSGWRLALALHGSGISTRRLAALWPVTAAPGARHWLETSMPEGTITRLEAGLRHAPGEDLFALSFAYRDALAYPVPTLPPISRAAGFGTLDSESFTITVQEGMVVPEGREPADISGSVFRIADLRQRPTVADVTLRARGPIGTLLAVLDAPRLGLLGRIGATPDLAAGGAELAAGLRFPLLKALKPAEVAVEAEAVLTDVSLARPVAGQRVTADRLALAATGRQMQLSGPVQLGQVPADIVWTETFRPREGTPPRRLEARLRLSEALLAGLGFDGLSGVLTGSAPARLTASLEPARPATFRIDADLGPAGLRLPGLTWTKPAGEAATLSISGTLAGPLALDRIELEARGLTLRGGISLDSAGRLAEAHFPVLRLADALDTSLTLRRGEAGPVVRLEGGTLDLLALGRLRSAPAPGEAEPDLRADLALDRIVLTPRIALTPATGTLRPADPGRPFLTVSGPANGGAETSLALTEAARGLTLRLSSDDAGQFLRDAGYFRHGTGGSLVLDMALAPEGPDMRGRLDIRDMLVRDAPVLSQILSVASITGPVEQLATGGLSFSTIEANFLRRDGLMTIERSLAIGGSVGLTVEGTYDETADMLDLGGVFTPAYLLNGIVGEVPLLGDLLAGGRGEGVFGFAYRVRGSADAPSVTVNPLSILTPGALRNVFSSQSAPVRDAPAEALAIPDLPAPPVRADRPAAIPKQGADR